MKLTVAKKELNTALNSVKRAVSQRPSHPILSCVKAIASVETQRLTLVGFDLNLAIEVGIDAQVSVGGAIAIPVRQLGDLVAKLPDGDLALTIDEGTLTIASGKSKYKIPVMPADEFPELPQVENCEPVNLPAQTLLDGLTETLMAASDEATKQVLCGIHFKLSPEKLEMAATDGHCLCVSEHFLGELNQTVETTISAAALGELKHALKGDLFLSLDSDKACFELENFKLTCRTLEGQYPNYPQLIPASFARTFTATRTDLISALERQTILAVKDKSVVEFLASHEQLQIKIETADVGAGEEIVPIQLTGESINLAFNPGYLLKGLRAMRSTEVQFFINEPLTPVILRPLGDRKMTYLVMPVNLRR